MDLGLQIKLQFARCIFLESVSSPFQRKFLLIVSISRITHFGKMNALMKYMGKADRTALTMTVLPAIDKEIAEEPDNLLATLWIRGK
jgi:hypothetical protein